MQCKDIPTLPILEFMALEPTCFHNWCFANNLDVRNAMPDGFSLDGNLVHAKMRQLISKGLVYGCTCGCRGDFFITKKGLDRLEELKVKRDFEFRNCLFVDYIDRIGPGPTCEDLEASKEYFEKLAEACKKNNICVFTISSPEYKHTQLTAIERESILLMLNSRFGAPDKQFTPPVQY